MAKDVNENRNRRIAVVIPAFDEADFIGEVIAAIPAFVSDIIVIDDASRDRTREVVAALKDPRVILIYHAVNRGVGAAVMTGYREALTRRADIVVKIDGDGQMNPADIGRLISPIWRGEALYTKGERFLDPKIYRKMPLTRFLGNLGLSFLTKAASGYWNLFDPTNGFTAITRQALQLLDFERLDNGYGFEISLLIELRRQDAVIRDVPIPAKYGSEVSELKPFKLFFLLLKTLTLAFFKRILVQYFVRDFSMTSLFILSGLPLLTFGVLFGAGNWYYYAAMLEKPAPTGTVLLAALTSILGFQLLLQAIVLDVGSTPDRLPPENPQDPDHPWL